MAATLGPDDPPTEDKDVVDEFNEEARAVLLETGLLGLPWSVLPEAVLFCLVFFPATGITSSSFLPRRVVGHYNFVENSFVIKEQLSILELAIITKYSSTLYIGMDEVLAHHACIFENSDLHFHFQ